MLDRCSPGLARTACAALLLATLPPAAHAIDCVYRGTDDSARVVRRSGEFLTPYPAALSDRNCERLRVESGAVDAVWAAGGNASRLVSRRVERGVLVPAGASPDPAAGERAGSVMQEVAVVLGGAQRRVLGSSRGDAGDLVASLLPTGRVAAPLADIVVTVGPEPDPLLQRFTLWRQGKVVHEQRGPAASLRLPAAALQPGSELTWELVHDGKVARGQLRAEAVGTLQALRDAAGSRHAGEPDPLLRQMRTAAELIAEGDAWYARQLLESALLR